MLNNDTRHGLQEQDLCKEQRKQRKDFIFGDQDISYQY